MLRLIANDEHRDHGQLLRSWLNGCDDGFMAVAFLKRSGLMLIEAELRNFLARDGCLRMVVGTDFHLTEPDTLRVLLRLGRDFRGFDWRLVDQSPVSTFHPKYYRFRGAGRLWVMTGSVNLTSGGMEGNVEVSAIAEDEGTSELSKEAVRVETLLWANERCRQPSEAIIGAYAVGFEVNRRRMTEAVKLAAMELEGLPELEGERLTDELRAYRSSEEQKKDLQRRRVNYESARVMIREKFGGSREVSPEDIERVYEALVGSKGGVKLWHSGSVQRSKTAVMRQKDEVLAMVREIEADLGREPEAMYDVGLRWMERISGLGPNVFTEFCSTLRPDRYAALNNNPVTSLRALGIEAFPAPSAFQSTDYGRFCRCMARLATRCDLSDLGEADHFLNFVYWRHKKAKDDTMGETISEKENSGESTIGVSSADV